ncbi:MAG: periplasmic heavy metal sensor [Bacteroidetes bacterium]|nr:periplasmic heavy metal sensor [Bacteroidota bacterium]
MNTRIIRITLLTVLSALLLGAQPGPGPERERRPGMHDKLNLTDAQKEQFEKISFDMKKKQIEIRAKLETARLELRRLIGADSFDKSAVEKKLTEIAGLEVQMKMNHFTTWSEKNKALTPEQQKVWKNTLKEQGAKRRQRPGRMMMQREMMDHDGPMKMERRIEKKIINE